MAQEPNSSRKLHPQRRAVTRSASGPPASSPVEVRSHRPPREIAMNEEPRPPSPNSRRRARPAKHPRPDRRRRSSRGSGKLKVSKAQSPAAIAASAGWSPSPSRARVRMLLIAAPNEDQDAKETQRRWSRRPERKAVLVAGDISVPEHCRTHHRPTRQRIWVASTSWSTNAAHQASFKSICRSHPDHELEHTFKVTIHAMFHLTKAAVRIHEKRCLHHQQRPLSTPTRRPNVACLILRRRGESETSPPAWPSPAENWHSRQRGRTWTAGRASDPFHHGVGQGPSA